ncbi:MAG: RidA family protein [Marinovum algicola]|mgnify:CR=1 FL=1|uniref:RidA family protein n=1 Tax=Roseobacteraceae TaxID=2854170 RepID=UPI0032EF77EB
MQDHSQNLPEITRHGRNPGSKGGPDRSSQIVICNGIAHFVSTPRKPYDPTLGAAQMMQQALDRVDERLALIGSDRTDLIKVEIWIRDMRFFAEINTVWDNWIDQDAMPLRCCCAVEMGSPDLKVELIVTARARKHPE